ncbi:MAG TPA: TetR/AcrR family transcriptional regulator [Bryobacteraceae bacterium]|nr:TetR/AcrR family transcriptional regulator [Bryobacteraceae bacterium]
MPRPRPYHHGNLREALLQAGIGLIAEAGPKGLTLREVARRAGVSHNAPYRHFQDKDELLAAVASQGFEELTESMIEAVHRQKTSLDRLRSAGLAYIEFALRRPQHFTVMFDAPVADGGDGPHDAGARAFQTLVDLIEACQKEGQLPPGDSTELARVAWSLVHGIAKLAVAGRFPGWTRTRILKFARSAIDSSIHGLIPRE